MAGDKLPVGVLRKPAGLAPLLPAVDRPRMARRFVSVAATIASSALLQSLLSTGYCAMKARTSAGTQNLAADATPRASVLREVVPADR